MNIPAIWGLRLEPQNCETCKQNNISRFGLKMASPLKTDTVCFKGTPKAANKAWEVSGTTARAIRRKIQANANKVEKFMNETFSDLVASEKEPNNLLSEIAFRVKSIQSIKEKTGSRQWVGADEILKEMTDLIGAKLVFRDASKSEVDAVLGRFIPFIKSGKLELLEIENKRPIAVKGKEEYEACKYDYATIKFLNKLIDVQNDMWKKGGNKQRVKKHLEDDFTKANYCATHFLFRIPGKSPVTFELQVLGHNVNEVKHIDDAVYKKLDGKNIAEDNPEFDKLFEPFINKKFFEEEPNAKEIVEQAKATYNRYRGELFLFQRTREPLAYSKKKKPESFLPLGYKLFPSDIEIKYGISSADYDYNNLNRILQRSKKKTDKAKPVNSKIEDKKTI